MAKKTEKKPSVDLTQKAYNGIRQMLFHNELVAGQKIPFQELADDMKMSPTPVVQALKFLEFQGIVWREPNKGYFIEQLKLEEVDELFRFRALLELSLLKETIAKLDADGEQALKEAHANYLDALGDVYMTKKLVTDMEFHLTIARLSNQALRVRALRNTFDLLHLKYQASLRYVTRNTSNENDHGCILDAILSRDTEQAQQLLADHIENSRINACDNLVQMEQEKAGLNF